MIYFGYPLDIHGWKPKPETEPETKPEPENRGRKTNTKPETRKTETRGYPHRTQSAAISRHEHHDDQDELHPGDPGAAGPKRR